MNTRKGTLAAAGLVVLVASLGRAPAAAVAAAPLTTIAITTRADNGRGTLSTLRSDGSMRTAVVRDAVPGDRPAWSPDGRYIAYSMNDQRSGNSWIWVVGADGQGARQLTPVTPDNFPPGVPAWSPDGAHIVYSRWGTLDPVGLVHNPGGDSIYQVDRDGTHVTRLTDPVLIQAAMPAWSPDGRRIAFDGSRSQDSSTHLFVMDSSGANVAPITSAGDADHLEPAWSPNGAQVAFVFAQHPPPTSSGWTGDQPPPWQIAVVNSDGSNLHTLTPAGERLTYSYAPTWTPDGSQLVFASYTGRPLNHDPGVNRLEMMNADGSGRHTVSTSDMASVVPAAGPLAATAAVSHAPAQRSQAAAGTTAPGAGTASTPVLAAPNGPPAAPAARVSNPAGVGADPGAHALTHSVQPRQPVLARAAVNVSIYAWAAVAVGIAAGTVLGLFLWRRRKPDTVRA